MGAEQIAEVVARATGIPVASLMAGERDKLLHMEARLAEQAARLGLGVGVGVGVRVGVRRAVVTVALSMAVVGRSHVRVERLGGVTEGPA